jgi:hypothetical protein
VQLEGDETMSSKQSSKTDRSNELRKIVISSQGQWKASTYKSAVQSDSACSVSKTSGVGVRQENQGLTSLQAERTQSGSPTDVVSSLALSSLLPILLDS